MIKPIPWTAKDDALLLECAMKRMLDTETSELMGRSLTAISRRRQKLLIRKPDGVSPSGRNAAVMWTEQETKTLRAMWLAGKSDSEIAQALPRRSPKSINARRHALKLYKEVVRGNLWKPARKRKFKPRPVPSPKDASILHLVDLIRAYGVQTLGEAKALYRERNEVAIAPGPIVHFEQTKEGLPAVSPFAWAV
jgi:hypothetical protein